MVYVPNFSCYLECFTVLFLLKLVPYHILSYIKQCQNDPRISTHEFNCLSLEKKKKKSPPFMSYDSLENKLKFRICPKYCNIKLEHVYNVVL